MKKTIRTYFGLVRVMFVLCKSLKAADNTVADDTAMLEENMILAREKSNNVPQRF